MTDLKEIRICPGRQVPITVEVRGNHGVHKVKYTQTDVMTVAVKSIRPGGKFSSDELNNSVTDTANKAIEERTAYEIQQ